MENVKSEPKRQLFEKSRIYHGAEQAKSDNDFSTPPAGIGATVDSDTKSKNKGKAFSFPGESPFRDFKVSCPEIGLHKK